jgi:ATP-dependent helicase YprA (DUF1998 family)
MPRPKRQKTRRDNSPKDLDAALAGSPIVPLRVKDVSSLDTTIEQRVGYQPRAFQMEAIRAQLLRKDVVVHAGTGMGKTLIAAGPHYHPAAAGKLTIMVSPLLALQTEQVSHISHPLNCSPEPESIGTHF